jgi:hypothetical protein
MKKLPLLIPVAVGLLSLMAGCSHHANVYAMHAHSTPDLALPYHVKTSSLDNDYPVPHDQKSTKANPNLVPPGLDLSKYHTKHSRHSRA